MVHCSRCGVVVAEDEMYFMGTNIDGDVDEDIYECSSCFQRHEPVATESYGEWDSGAAARRSTTTNRSRHMREGW